MTIWKPFSGYIAKARLTVICLRQMAPLKKDSTYYVRFDCCREKLKIISHQSIVRRRIRQPELCGDCVRSDRGRIRKAIAERKRVRALYGMPQHFGVVPPTWAKPPSIVIDRCGGELGWHCSDGK